MKKESMMKIKLILLILLAFVSACSTDTKKNATDYILNARKYVAATQLNNAVIEYKNAIQVEPKNDTAFFELAETYVLMKKIETAIRHYEDAIKANPDHLVARMRLAQIYLKTERLYEARTKVSEILAKSPENIPAHHLLSSIQIKERDLDAAIGTLEQAEKIDPSVIKTHLSLAKLYIVSNKIDKAEQAYLKAIAVDASQRDSYIGLVNLYNSLGKWDKSEDLFKKILSKPGAKEQKYLDAAIFYESLKQIEPAEKHLLMALSESSAPYLIVELSRFYARHDNREAALKNMDRILSSKNDEPGILTALATIYFQFGMVQEATNLIDKVLKKHDRFSDALIQKGKIKMLKNDFASAVNSFDAALKENNMSADAYYYKAVCIQKNGTVDNPEQKLIRASEGLLNDPESFEKEQVKKNLKAAILIDPSMLEPRFLLTEIYLLEKDEFNANEQLKELVRLAPNHKKTVSLITGMKLLEGDVKSAETILLAIVKQYPDDFPAHFRLGMLYKSQGRSEDALVFFKRAFAIDKTQTGVVKLIVDILKGEKRFEEAVGFVQNNMQLSDSSTQPFINSIQGDIAFAEGNMEKALSLFKSAVEANPKDVKSYIMIARILELKQQYDKALEIYILIEKIDPRSIPVLMGIGYNYERLGNLSGAESYYRKTLQQDPKHPFAANNLAYILSRHDEKIDEALALAQIARQGRPDDANILDTLGWLYYKKGNLSLAISELEESLKANPNNPLAHFHLGMSLYQLKDFEKARTYLKKALELDPKFDGSDIAIKLSN